jgi:hypothetical protein
MQIVDAEFLEGYGTFAVKVYVPVKGQTSMDKLYYTGYTKKEVKELARREAQKLGLRLRLI